MEELKSLMADNLVVLIPGGLLLFLWWLSLVAPDKKQDRVEPVVSPEESERIRMQREAAEEANERVRMQNEFDEKMRPDNNDLISIWDIKRLSDAQGIIQEEFANGIRGTNCGPVPNEILKAIGRECEDYARVGLKRCRWEFAGKEKFHPVVIATAAFVSMYEKGFVQRFDVMFLGASSSLLYRIGMVSKTDILNDIDRAALDIFWKMLLIHFQNNAPEEA